MPGTSGITDPEFDHLKKMTVVLKANQGDLTVAKKRIQHDGAVAPTFEFASPIAKDNFLVIDPANDFTVIAAAAGTTTLLGFAADNPSPKDGRISLPTAEDTYSNIFEGVRVELQGDYIRSVPLAAGATAVTRGDSIQPDSAVAHEWEGSGSQTGNGTMALNSSTATNPVTVLFFHQAVYA